MGDPVGRDRPHPGGGPQAVGLGRRETRREAGEGVSVAIGDRCRGRRRSYPRGMTVTMTSEEIIDISLTVGPDMLVWPGDPPVGVEPAAQVARGDPANVSTLRLGSHTGTHVDPPAHFVAGGATVVG